MTALAEEIRERIRRDGPINVATYMELCLHHPAHGYYRRGRPIGAAGDFVTAPEVSQMFGELIGLWCAATWQSMGQPQRVRLVELGPGRGTLLADALRAVRTVPAFPDAIDLHLVESSESLRAEQAGLLADAHPTWHERFETVPPGPVVVIANEFFDALPIRQFERIDGTWQERVVTLAPSSQALRFAPTDSVLVEAGLGCAPSGAIVERAPAREALAGALAKRIAAEGGAALIIDYGHEQPGFGDTLQAMKRHSRHDALDEPGNADLTAHVDFSALASAARREGAHVFGPMPQGRFLKGLGIEARAARLRQGASADQVAKIDSALRRLTGVHGMGELFKALAVVHPTLTVPPGFETEARAAP